jgi:predicted ABC-type ATPase
MIRDDLDARPVIVAIAGPNGAGKTTFFHSHLSQAGLRFINADDIAGELDLPAYEAAALAATLRDELVRQRESFIFETVFSDPVGDKLAFLRNAAAVGYAVVLCFIGISSPAMAEQRVAMRLSQGGHDVPSEKLAARFPRTMANLQAAIRSLPIVIVFDNSKLAAPFRRIAEFRNGDAVFLADPVPRWLRPLL